MPVNTWWVLLDNVLGIQASLMFSYRAGARALADQPTSLDYHCHDASCMVDNDQMAHPLHQPLHRRKHMLHHRRTRSGQGCILSSFCSPPFVELKKSPPRSLNNLSLRDGLG
ncbi:MAG: hypothetical protein IMY85_09635 [Chloroflexi bacterium]|nr:hypothetical protein [Chloroflexota bacterium]